MKCKSIKCEPLECNSDNEFPDVSNLYLHTEDVVNQNIDSTWPKSEEDPVYSFTPLNEDDVLILTSLEYIDKNTIKGKLSNGQQVTIKRQI